jgi:hypothetical protein
VHFRRGLGVESRNGRRLVLEDGGEHVAATRRGERTAASNHLVEQHPERPNVRPGVHRLPTGLLRGHVRSGAHHRARVGVDPHLRGIGSHRRSRRELGQAKVQHLQDAVRPEHDVLGFDVAVDDPRGMRDAQRRGDLNGDVKGLTHGEPRRGESSPKGLSLDVLHRDVVLALARLVQRVNRADVRVIERGRSAGLLLEAQDAAGIAHEFGGQELQGHLAPEAQLGREPHLAHASSTDEGDDFVRADPCARL